jgi:hypothetical protein
MAGWRVIETARPFLDASGPAGTEAALRAGFGILAGRSDDATLLRLAHTGRTGRRHFVNDDCWWTYTDFQCHFHALHGWRPFCGPEVRGLDLATWSAGFVRQVTEADRPGLAREQREPPPAGWLPASYSSDGEESAFGAFSCNESGSEDFVRAEDTTYPGFHLFSMEGTHDLNPDYPLLNCLTATDWMLWERDAAAAREYLPRIEAFLAAMASRADASGFFLFGPQGSQMEFSHGGWRRQSSTHLYYAAACARVADVYAMLGEEGPCRQWQEEARRGEARVERFRSPGGWLVSGFDQGFTRVFGTGLMDGSPSDYLEVWPNVIAAVIGMMDRGRMDRLAARMEEVPAFTRGHLTVSNWPARPVEELDDDHDGFPPPGTHVNGGFFWMHGGCALGMYARAGRPETLERLEELLEDYARHLSVDYYNDWGRNKEAQFPNLPRGTHSVTSAGAPGHFFRGALGLEASADRLRVSPSLPPQLERLAMQEPVHWGGRRLFVEVTGQGVVHRATVDGRTIPLGDPHCVEIPFAELLDGARICIEMR